MAYPPDPVTVKGDKMKTKYLICRKDALRGGTMRNSEHWPCIVEADSPETAIDAAFKDAYSPAGPREYVVVPMTGAIWLTVTPRRDYQIRRVGAYG